MQKMVLVVAMGSLMCGCTVLEVSPVRANANLTHVAIVKNPKVRVSNFTSVLKKEFEKRGISAEVYPGLYGMPKSDCIVTYTALRDWDLAPYMTYAEISIRQNNKQIGYGEFRHRGGGNSLSPFKWRGTKAKIGPLMDELLKNYPVH